MGTMTCVKCSKAWYERGVDNNTICDECSRPEEELEDDQLSEEFEDIVKEMMDEEELELLKDVDWDDLKLMGAEYVALQLRWILVNRKKGRVE